MIRNTRSYARLLVIGLLLLLNMVAMATVEPYRNQLKGTIKKGDSLIVKDEKFRNPSFDWTDMTSKSVINRVSLSLIQDSPVVLKKAFSTEVDLKIEYFANPEQVEPITIDNIKLKVNYAPDSGIKYRGEDFYEFNNGYWVKVTVNNITSPELKDSIPPVLQLTGQVMIDRTYKVKKGAKIGLFGNLGQSEGMVQQRVIGGNTTINNNFLHLSWETETMFQEYDLEWAVFDERSEHEATLTNMETQIVPVEDDEIDYIFRNNATRVTLGKDQPTYDISMIYNSHYIVVRVRGVYYNTNGYRVEDDWHYKLSDNSGYALWVIGNNWHQQKLNWQYSGTFAEDGKKKEVVSYFDGTLRSRQTVTVNNEDKVAVIQETIYDEFGRAAASILPAPKIGANTINFYKNFNRNSSNKPYNYINLANDGSSVNCLAPPQVLNTEDGASKYYSAANQLISGSNIIPYNKYIPDAEGYPLSVTQYVPDNTGRIRLQGGVGKKFQPGNSALTKYYYGKPESWELDRLFGNDVGYADHYLKNMVVDPNGQVSISYLNAAGKTIATALAGGAPANLAGLRSKGDPVMETIKILRPQQFVYDPASLSLTAKTTYLNSLPNQMVAFNYDIEQLIYNYQGSSFQICSNCYYDFSIRILNDCDDVVYATTANTFIGSALSNCNNPALFTGSFTRELKEVGEYYVNFELKLSKKAIEDYTDNYIRTNTDLHARFKFVMDYLNTSDFDDCFSDCNTCKIALGTSAQFLEVLKTKLEENDIKFDELTQQQKTQLENFANTKHWQLSDLCQALQQYCNDDPCAAYERQMLLDVAPGGQYALYQTSPFMLLEPGVNVLTFANFRAKFPVLAVGHQDYEATAFYLDNGQKTSPHDASFTLEMLVKYWRPEWAAKFLEYHPEYCKLEACRNVGEYIKWDNQVKQFYNKVEDIPQIPQTSNLQYRNDYTPWFLDHDPFFVAGPGYLYYSQMYTDLHYYSRDVLNMPNYDVKTLSQVVDYLLYCADPAGTMGGMQWSSCNTESMLFCRLPDREWQKYREMYFQLKEKYYAMWRDANACAGKCAVGTPISISGCANLTDFVIREAGTTCAGGRELKILYAKGKALRPMTVELYYPSDYAGANIPTSVTFSVNDVFKTICVPASMPVSAIRIKNVTCSGNIAAPPCQGTGGQLDITTKGIIIGTHKFEQKLAGVRSTYTLIPGTLDQPPSEVGHCVDGSTFSNKQFYNCYRVLLPGGATADFSNVWVITCVRDFCAEAPVHSMSYAIGYYQYYNASDAKIYTVFLEDGTGGYPPCEVMIPSYEECLKIQVSGQPVQTFTRAVLLACDACDDPFSISPSIDLGNNSWKMADGTIYKVFPNTVPNYQPPADGCTYPTRTWFPCFGVTMNGNTQYFQSATVTACYEDTDPCAVPPVIDVMQEINLYHYSSTENTRPVDYYIIDGYPEYPPYNEYCNNGDMGFYDCIAFAVPGHSPKNYYNVWVIRCEFFGGGGGVGEGGSGEITDRMAVVAHDTTTIALQSGQSKVVYGFSTGKVVIPYLIKKADTKDNAKLKAALRPKRGFETYRFYKKITIQKPGKYYEAYQNVWVARRLPDAAVQQHAARKTATSVQKTSVVAMTSNASECVDPIPYFSVNTGELCGSGRELWISLNSEADICEQQSYTANVYIKIGAGTIDVGTVTLTPPFFTPQSICWDEAQLNAASAYGACLANPVPPCGPTNPTCPEAYQYKQSRFPQTGGNVSLSAQDITDIQNENLALIQQQIATNCEAQADGWIARLEDCLSAYSGTDKNNKIAALKAGFIDVCKRGGDMDHPGGSSTTRPGESNPSSFKQVIQAVLGSTLTMNCNPWLIDEPYPYLPVAQNATRTISVANAGICDRLQQLKTEHTTNEPGKTFHQFLTDKYGEAMNLTAAQLAMLENTCNGCRYLLEEDMPLPVFLEPGAVGCITRTEYLNAIEALNLELGGAWDPNHNNASDVLANFMNHRFGFAMSYFRYKDFETASVGNASALLCNNPPYRAVEIDHYACVKTVVALAIANGTREYDQYIAEERRKFRLNYVNTCSLAKGNATATGYQQQYHFTLYYYDQAGNLVRTVSPEGVRPLTLVETDIVNQWRLFNAAACTGEGVPSVGNINASLTAFSNALQNNAKAVEMWMYSGTNDDTRQVRLITPDNKYLYQVAISDYKLWVELYSLQPTPTLLRRGVADITSINLQPWSHLLVSATNITSATWTIYLEGKKLTLMTANIPAYPFDFVPGAMLPPATVSQLKHLRIYNQQPATDAVVFNTYSNSCMMPEAALAAGLVHWGRFNIPRLCQGAETRLVNNQGGVQITGNTGMDANPLSNVQNNFTMELWVNPTQPHEIDPEGTGVWCCNGVDGQKYVVYPSSAGSSGGSTIGISVGTNGVSVYEHAEAYMPAVLVWQGTINKWTHIAVVYKEKIPYLYVDGVYRKAGLPSTKTFVSPGSNISSGPYGVMLGGVDEFRVWSVARSGTEIVNSYKSGVHAGSTGLAAYWSFAKQEGTAISDLTCGDNTLYFTSGSFSWNTTTLPVGIKDIVPVEYAVRGYYPAHKLTTSYAFNSTGQVVRQKSPDGGDSYFWYDRLGRLFASQNGEQRSRGNVYSYTKYEPVLSRVIEVGEKTTTSHQLGGVGFVNNETTITVFQDITTNSQIIKTVYDKEPELMIDRPIGVTLGNLRKRISATIFRESAGDNNYNATYYDYDLMGNVNTLYQKVDVLPVRKIGYEYDLVSGKVNLIKYQEGEKDEFYYIYKYDAENRLTEAKTDVQWNGTEGVNSQLNAYYKYYLHGPLARLELGGPNKVQGLDYAYTLQGWLKGVNGDKLNTANEMGGDGFTGNLNIAKDVYAYSLGYYTGDYKPIAASANAFSLKYGSVNGSITGSELYNGNISNTTVAISRFRGGDPAGYSYGYDQLNRLVQMRHHLLTGSTTTWNSSTITEAYKETVTYDGNGNILTYLRNGADEPGKPKLMDNLSYGYNEADDPVTGQKYLLNNRLRHVKDDAAIPATNYTEDLDTQVDDYYRYDQIGNLKEEGELGKEDRIKWTVYGKISEISKGPVGNPDKLIRYSYDAAGNRIKKYVKVKTKDENNNDIYPVTTTWYVRDAQGNLLGLYNKKDSGPLKWKEQHLYGSSRIGMWEPDINVETVTGGSVWGNVGTRSYELTNHLGNVLAVITDKRTTGTDGAFQAEITTANDYYPFGMQMPGRSIIGADCQEVEKDLTVEVANSDLTSGVTQSGTEFWHNGVRWQRLNNATIAYVNGAIRCNNGGTSSDGVAAYIPAAGVAPNTTYIMEFDIVEKSSNITYFNCQAHSPGNDVYRVMTRKTGSGHHSFVFTTPAVMPQYIRLRITSNLIGLGTYFTVDNFVCRKYTVVNQTEVAATDFNNAVMNGVDVESDGMTFKPLQPQYSTISLTGTTDKKITVNCTNVNESWLIMEMPLIPGEQYLLKFTMTQALADKRLGMRVFARTNGVWELSEAQGMFYVGSGPNVFNFKFPLNSDRVSIQMYRASSGQTWDGYNVPYTIDNYSLTRLEPITRQLMTVCDPGADPSGENGIYRYGFNGQEKSREINGKGDSYTAEFWQYDARLGRRWNTDPVVKNDESPYMVLGNSPIVMVDPNGNDWYKNNETGAIEHKRGHRERKGYTNLGGGKTLVHNGYEYDKSGVRQILSEVVVTAKVKPKRDSDLSSSPRNGGIYWPNYTKADAERWLGYHATIRDRHLAEQPLVQEGDPLEYRANFDFYERAWQAEQTYRSAQYGVVNVATFFVPLPKVGMLRWIAKPFGNAAGRVFWSGGGMAKTAFAQATEHAIIHGGTTLEGTLAGKTILTIQKVVGNKSWFTGKLWSFATKRFAKGAVGDVHAYLQPSLFSPKPAWFVEKAILDSRGIKIIEHTIP